MAQRTAGPPRSGAIQDQCQREGRFERVEQPMPWFLYSRGPPRQNQPPAPALAKTYSRDAEAFVGHAGAGLL
jgi:hypothetical protein